MPSSIWTDASRPVDERVDALLEAMTLDEKLAQLGSAWVGKAMSGGGDSVAPLQDAFATGVPYEEASRDGLGHLTRVLGSRPVDPVDGARRVHELQADLCERTRLGIPAIAHEECLTGFTTYGATVFPTPLALAATFDPAAVERMTRAIGEGLRAAGAHQGLSPVLDVVRDYRWGRVEETFGEDPYLVGMIGCGYVRGLESAGVVATLKHFAGYSASAGGRNHGPVSIGPRELRDTILPPFEMAIREAGARSVMNSYSELDGVPAGADPGLLTAVLRDEWGFEGVVVSDYWAVSFLRMTHGVAADQGEAAALALRAGIDVELPDLACYGEPLRELVRDGTVSERLVDRAARRVLRQKVGLGLLDDGVAAEPPARLDLDPPESRALARELAEASVVLLDAGDGVLPIGDGVRSLAVIGPCAAEPRAFCGCYSYPSHVLDDYPGLGLGVEVSTLFAALRGELPGVAVTHEPGCPVQAPDRSGFAAAADAARAADLCVAVVGDRPGMFGRGTSGEGCDAEDLELPGVQGELVEALIATGTPVVLVVVSGRPYALGRYAGRMAAAVQAFLPGEEGGGAIAGVLSGRLVPSGKLPVQIPHASAGQPSTYLHPYLGGRSGVSNLDTTPLYAFGHGCSYTTFEYSGLRLSAEQVPTDGELELSCLVRNTGERAGTEVVQLYVADPVARVTRPVVQLAGFARVPLEPGEAVTVGFRLHADRLAFTDRDLRRVVEPGTILVMVGGGSEDIRLRSAFELTGPERHPGRERALTTPAQVAGEARPHATRWPGSIDHRG